MSRFLPRRRSSAAYAGRHRPVPSVAPPAPRRGRRATSLVATVLAMSGSLVVVTTATTTVTAAAAPRPFGCDAFGYLFQGSSIKKVDLVGNTNVEVKGDVPGAPNLNGVGYNPRDNLFYGKYTDNGDVGLASVDADYVVTKLPGTVDGLGSNWNLGDFDAQGHLWMSNTLAWIEVDLVPGSPTFGQTLRQGTLTQPAGLDTGADWGYINGAFYRVMATTAAVGAIPQGTGHVVRFTPPAPGTQGDGTVTDLGALREGPLGTPGYLNTANNGAVYPQGGYLWSSENQSGEIRRIDVRTLAVAGPYPGPSSGQNDGARCATAPIPTLTVTKQVAGRAAANDQFTVSVTRTGSSAVEASATTTGTQTTATTPNTPVSQDTSYTITDAMAAGSTSTLANYTPTISCRDVDTGGTLATTGSAPSWRVTVPGTDDYACTVTNTLIQNDLRIVKSGPATTTANGTVAWTLAVSNLSGTTSPRDTVVDTLPIGFTAVQAPGCTVTGSDAAGYVVTCEQGLLVAGASAPAITITAKAPATYSTPYVNTARVSGPITDLNQTNNTSSFTTTVGDGTLTLAKQVSAGGSTPAQSANAVPGQVVTYTVTATDTGGGTWSAANPATFSDDLTDVLKDSTYVPGSATASTGTVTPPAAGGSTLAWSGVPSGTTPVTVTYQVRVNDPDLAGDHTMVNTVSSPFAAGCTPATCSTTTRIAQLQVGKEVASSTGPATPGSTLTYTVTVSNPGTGAWPATGAADTAAVADDFSDVVASGTYNSDATVNPGNNAGATNAQLVRTASGLRWSGPLPAGTGFTITYSVTLADPFVGADHDLVNTVTAPHSNCIAAGTPGCTTTTPVADLVAAKSSPTTTPLPGGTVSYTITLTNPGSVAWTDTTRPTATDSLADVLDDATWNNDATATLPGGGAATGSFGATPSTTVPLTWTGTVPARGTVTITYSVTVDTTSRAGANQRLTNGVRTPVGACGPNGTATACPTVTQDVPSLTTTKVVSSNTANPGQSIQYTILLTNTGKAAWPAGTRLFTDDLSDVLDDADLTTGPVATNPDDPAGVTRTGNTLVYDAALGADHSASIVYTVTVKSPVPSTADHSLGNTVVPIVPCTSGCSTSTLVPDLTIMKTADTADASEGSRITYTVTATNTGGTAWTVANPAVITDDMSAALDDATFDGNVTVTDPSNPTPPAAVRNARGFTWTGPLAQNATVTFTYSVVVNTPDTGDRILPNAIVTPNGGNCTTGSTAPGCTTTTKTALLQVTKQASTTATSEGSVVRYTITATNNGEGNWTSTNPAVITDDLTRIVDDATPGTAVATGAPEAIATQPAYLTPDRATLRWTGALNAKSTVVITYDVTVNTPDLGDRVMLNTVTAPGGGCRAGCSTTTTVADLRVTKTSDVQDAAPGSVVHYTITATNPADGAWTAENPASLSDDLTDVLDDATFNGDAVTTGDSTVQPDVSGLPILRWTGPLAGHATITIRYSVTVKSPNPGDGRIVNAVTAPGNCRAGSTDATCRTQTDVPTLTVSKVASTGDAYPGAVVRYTITAANNGPGDWTAAHPAHLSDDLSAVLDDATWNDDAVTSGDSTVPLDDSALPVLTWDSPLAAGKTASITYTVTIKSPDTGDHRIVNTVVGPPGTVCAAGSTVPACGATTRIADLTVAKTSSAVDTGPGQQVTYTLSVANSGTGDWTAANPAVVTDNLTDVLDDATYNDDVVTTGDTTVPATFATPRLTWTGPLESGQAFVLTYSVTVNDPDTGNHRLVNAVTALGNCTTPAAPGCSTTTEAADLDVVKTADRDDAVPGSVLTYSLVVRNNGQGDWTATNPALVSDDLSGVLDDATFNDDATTDPAAGAFDFTAPTLRWTGPLAAGASLTIRYSVTVNAPDTGDHRLINAVSSVGTCRTGCSVETDVPDLAVSKVASSGTTQPGATLTYTITATNTGEGDWTATNPAALSDDLSGVLDDATYNDDATVTGGSAVRATYTAPTLSWTGPLAAGASFTITYSVTVNSPDRGDHTLPNAVVGPPGTLCAAGSTDPACVTATGIADLAISKTASTDDIGPGQTVTYTVIATSVGTAPWTSAYAPVTDDLTAQLDDAVYNDDAVAVVSAGTATQPTYTEPTLSWSGDLEVGATVTITYSVTIDNPDTGDHKLPNTIAGAGNCADPTDPTCTTDTRIADLTVTKTADRTNAAPGAKVTYTVTATNSGAGDWTDTNPAALSDDVSKVVDDATWNDDVTIDGSTVAPTYTEPTLAWTGALAAGQTVTITYSVTVNSPDLGDHDLGNTIVSAAGDCQAGVDNPSCTANPKVPDLEVSKTASSDVADPGKALSYSIVVTNTGQGDWTATEPAIVTDDLTKVLDDAAWNGDATVTGTGGTLQYEKPTLTWTGPLAAGASVTITYSVTVLTPDTGDHRLVNTVRTPAGNCTDPTAEGCTTDTAARSYTVTKTSDPASGEDVAPGQTVHYTLTIVNTGQADLTPVVTDDLTQALDDATWNDDASAPSGTAAFSDPTLTWTGPLAVGATVKVTYSLTVKTAGTGDGRLVNVVVGNGPETNCADVTQCTTDSGVSSSDVSTVPGGGGPVTGGPSTPAYTGVDSQWLLIVAGLLLLMGLLALLLGRGGAGGRTRRSGPRGPSSGPSGRRLLPAAIVAVLGLTACSGGSADPAPSTSAAPSSPSASATGTGGGAATVSVAGKRAELQVTSCTASKSVVQVVAQAGAAWTAQFRQDVPTGSTFLVLVHHTGKTVQTYQASANSEHPAGLGKTRIAATRKGKSFSAEATLTSSSVTLGGKTPKAKAGSTRTGSFAATCTRPAS